MATTAPTPTWSMGNVVQYTDSGVTDDTEQWSLGNISSFLEYEAAAGGLSIPRPLSRPFAGPLGGI